MTKSCPCRCLVLVSVSPCLSLSVPVSLILFWRSAPSSSSCAVFFCLSPLCANQQTRRWSPSPRRCPPSASTGSCSCSWQLPRRAASPSSSWPTRPAARAAATSPATTGGRGCSVAAAASSASSIRLRRLHLLHCHRHMLLLLLLARSHLLPLSLAVTRYHLLSFVVTFVQLSTCLLVQEQFLHGLV